MNKAYDKRRLMYDVGIGYGDDSAQARQLILEAVRGVKGVLPDPAPDALVMDLGESPVNIQVHRWINLPWQADVLDAQDGVLEAIKNKLSANGIDLPYPTLLGKFCFTTRPRPPMATAAARRLARRLRQRAPGPCQRGPSS